MGIEEIILEQARQEGMEKGMEKGMEMGMEMGKLEALELAIRSLIIKMGLSNEQVAATLEVPLRMVLAVRSKMTNP